MKCKNILREADTIHIAKHTVKAVTEYYHLCPLLPSYLRAISFIFFILNDCYFIDRYIYLIVYFFNIEVWEKKAFFYGYSSILSDVIS